MTSRISHRAKIVHIFHNQPRSPQQVVIIVLILATLLASMGCGSKSEAQPPDQTPANKTATGAERDTAVPEGQGVIPPAGQSDAGEPPQSNEPPRPSPTTTPTPEPDEQLTITGQVRLPPDGGLAMNTLAVLTNLGLAPLDPSGNFTADLARNPAYPSLIILVNATGNPLLMATRRGAAVAEPWELSADSTAEALVLFDPSVWSLDRAQQDQLAAALREHSFYQYLIETVAAGLQSDPESPLNSELHRDPYDIAALITGELLKSLASTQRSSRPGAFKALFTPVYRPLPKSNDFVWVEDDINHNLPEVTLVNNTFCFYKATVFMAPEGGQPAAWQNTAADPLILDKSKLYSFRFMPTSESNMGTERTVSPGDGNLRFVFVKDTQRTLYDLGWSLIGGIVGGMGAGVAQQDKAVYGMLKEGMEALYGDLMLVISSGKGKSSGEMAGEVTGWFAKNSLKVALAYAEGMSAEWKKKASSEFVKQASEILGSKVFAGVTAGYAGAEFGATAYSLANSPDELSEQGVQRDGRYPAFRISALPSVIRLPDLTNLRVNLPGQSSGLATELATETLVVTVEDIPEEMSSFQLYIDYQDGTPPKTFPVTVNGDRYSMEDVHTFIAISPAVRIEVLDFMTSQPVAGISVPVVVGAAATNEIYTLRFEYDPGACVNWQCEMGWNSCSRVHSNLPVRLIGSNKLVIAYGFEGADKHMQAYGSGSLSGKNLQLWLTSSFQVDKTCPAGETWEPCQLKEDAAVSVSGLFDPTLTYEQALIASGESVVKWPLTEPPPSKDNSLSCTAGVVKAFISPGYKDYGR